MKIIIIIILKFIKNKKYMERHHNDISPASVISDDYKYPSCEFPRTLMFNSEESVDRSIFNTFSKKRNKKVKFNDNVTIINIQSHKKKIRKQNNKNLKEKIEQDFREEEERRKACADCIVF